MTVEWRSFEVSQNDKLQRITVDSISLPTHTSSVKFSPNQEKLLICCIDGSLTVYDQIKGTNYNIKLAFVRIVYQLTIIKLIIFINIKFVMPFPDTNSYFLA